MFYYIRVFFREELKEMSSEGQYYKLDSFKDLAELVKTIKKTLCKSK